MSHYRRIRRPGGTYFFTLKTEGNSPIFGDDPQVRLLGQVLRETKTAWPFYIDAIVVLPDHIHAIWTLPTGDHEYPKRWGWLKKTFTSRFLRGGGTERVVSRSRRTNRRRGVWQRRFWEHTIRNEDDFDRHFDYIHWNPVKHGYVNCPADWRYSSFHRWAKLGIYSALGMRRQIAEFDRGSARHRGMMESLWFDANISVGSAPRTVA
ncbi:MAG: transposase [Pirellulales bacterium]